MQAYKKYGVAKGTILTAWRLCRCNPFGNDIALIQPSGTEFVDVFSLIFDSRSLLLCRWIWV